MKKLALVLGVALILACCACAAPAQPSAAPVQEAEASLQPVQTPEPTPFPTMELESVMRDSFSEACYPSAVYPRDTGENDYSVIMNNAQITREIQECFSVWTEEAAARLEKEYQSYGEMEFRSVIQQPSWQMLASAALACETPQDIVALFPQMINSSVDVMEGSDGKAVVELNITPKTPQVLFYELPNTAEDPTSIPSGFFTCTYLLTLFDENMELVENSGELPELSEQLTFPFEERYEYRNGWFNDRDGGARRHTGTDILCPEGTPELACVDGTILAKGSGKGTGNYVVLEGADQTQYHYYHMVEVSNLVSAGDTVKRGEPLGLAGNTGNSTANHLHLAIITPSGQYVNPYPYLRDALDAGE